MKVIISRKIPSYTPKNKKTIDEWSNRDLLLYFSNKYNNLVEVPFNIPKDAWGAMMSRIKGFKSKMHLSNEEYKLFIDNMFDKFFTQDNYVPTFGSIVSEKVFFTIKKLLKNPNVSNSEFELLKSQLYSNNSLFKKFL